MQIKSLDIRIGKTSDAQAISRVHDESWRSSYQGILPGKELERAISKRGQKWWANAIDKGLRVILIEYDNTVIGYATIGTSRVKWSVPAGEVYELYLLPIYQGLGFGRKLLKAASHKLEELGYKAMLIWCLKENKSACDFYQHVKGTPVAKAHEKFEGRPVLKTGFAWKL